MEDNLKKKKWKTATQKNGEKWKTTLFLNGRRPKKKWKTTSKKMEDNLKYNLKKETLIGCDIMVNSPSLFINWN